MVERSETTRIGGHILRDARERSRESSLLVVSRDHTAVGLDCFSSFFMWSRFAPPHATVLRLAPRVYVKMEILCVIKSIC